MTVHLDELRNILDEGRDALVAFKTRQSEISRRIRIAAARGDDNELAKIGEEEITRSLRELEDVAASLGSSINSEEPTG